MADPLVSVITIVLNDEKHIEQTILSVLNQSYKKIEYIIIDGKSNDNTINIIKKYEKSVNHWISEHDSGISDAFNKGIEKATGKIIGMINSGDKYNSDAIQRVVQEYNYQDDPDNFHVFHGDLIIESEDGQLRVREPFPLSTFPFQMPVWHPTCFLTKDIYERYKYDKDYRIAMDYELLCKVFRENGNFIYINYPITIMSETGISNKRAIKSFLEVRRASNINLGVNLLLSWIYFSYRVILMYIVKLKRRFS